MPAVARNFSDGPPGPASPTPPPVDDGNSLREQCSIAEEATLNHSVQSGQSSSNDTGHTDETVSCETSSAMHSHPAAFIPVAFIESIPGLESPPESPISWIPVPLWCIVSNANMNQYSSLGDDGLTHDFLNYITPGLLNPLPGSSRTANADGPVVLRRAVAFMIPVESLIWQGQYWSVPQDFNCSPEYLVPIFCYAYIQMIYHS